MSFYKPYNLPNLMVAPNGSRRMKSDHNEIPMTINEMSNSFILNSFVSFCIFFKYFFIIGKTNKIYCYIITVN